MGDLCADEGAEGVLGARARRRECAASRRGDMGVRLGEYEGGVEGARGRARAMRGGVRQAPRPDRFSNVRQCGE
jgi:hypothetical protein